MDLPRPVLSRRPHRRRGAGAACLGVLSLTLLCGAPGCTSPTSCVYEPCQPGGNRSAPVGLLPGLAEWHARGHYICHRGRRIFFRREGRGETLLALHGFPTASYDFHELWPTLTGRFDVIAPDLLGCGFSAKPPDHDFSVLEQANIVEALLNQLGVERVHILAHDLGDTLAQELLARDRERPGPPRIESVVFANGGLFLESQELTCAHHVLGSPCGDLAEPFVCEPIYRHNMRNLLGPGPRGDAVDLAPLWQLLNYDDGRFVLHEVIQYLQERDRFAGRWTDALQTADAPLALIYGPEDPVSGETVAQTFAAAVPRGRRYALPGVGHYPQLEDPRRFLLAFEHFHNAIGTPPAGAPPRWTAPGQVPPRAAPPVPRPFVPYFREIAP